MSAFPRRSTTLPPGEGAEQPALPQLPADIWQHIARLALVAEDGDPRAWATLRAVSTAFRAGAACAVVPPEALLTEAPVSGERYGLWSACAYGPGAAREAQASLCLHRCGRGVP